MDGAQTDPVYAVPKHGDVNAFVNLGKSQRARVVRGRGTLCEADDDSRLALHLSADCAAIPRHLATIGGKYWKSAYAAPENESPNVAIHPSGPASYSQPSRGDAAS